MRENIVLECTECKSRNYTQDKNKRLHPERVEFTKFCKKCGNRTTHKETK